MRCRKDVEDGKMSILVQHKKNPLDGDSSSTSRGKSSFFIKDASAVHEFPNVVVIGLPIVEDIKRGKLAFMHLTVTNPKAVAVQIRVAHNDDYNGGPFNRACVGRLQLSNEPPNSPLTFTLGCYEDELLRDQDDGDDVMSLSVPESTFCVVSQNAALVKCPVSLNERVAGDGATTVYILPLVIFIEEMDPTATTASARRKVEVVVAFPVGYS